MADTPLEETDDGMYDYAHIPRHRLVRRRSNPGQGGNRLTAVVAVGSLLLQLAAIAWTGGRLEQRVTEHDKQLGQQAQEIKELNKDISQQSSVLAATNATYVEILRRLESGDSRDTRIETKIDELRRTRR